MTIVYTLPCSNTSISVYFGNAEDALSPKQYAQGARLLTQEPYKKLAKLLAINRLFFLRQIHSASGREVTEAEFDSFTVEGDYLITQQKNTGLGVMSADCLPIVLYDARRGAVAVVHAGRRGTVAGIAQRVVAAMQKQYGTAPEDLRVFFGPSIKSCCYVVGTDVCDELGNMPFAHKVLRADERGVVLDLPLLNMLQLTAIGVPEKAIEAMHTVCTACDVRYCSYRRDGDRAGRQMTVVAISYFL